MAELAELTYDPVTERLAGRVGAVGIDLRVLSGGHRGALDPALWGDTAESRDQRRPGGPIPSGRYAIHWLGEYVTPRGVALGRCCFLWPDEATQARITATGRVWNDFLIHAPGRVGSLGCLVPWPRTEFERLMALLEGQVDERRGTLVVAAGPPEPP